MITLRRNRVTKPVMAKDLEIGQRGWMHRRSFPRIPFTNQLVFGRHDLVYPRRNRRGGVTVRVTMTPSGLRAEF